MTVGRNPVCNMFGCDASSGLNFEMTPAVHLFFHRCSARWRCLLTAKVLSLGSALGCLVLNGATESRMI